MNLLNAIFRGLQSKPMYRGTARPTERKFKQAKKRRQIAKASRRANR